MVAGISGKGMSRWSTEVSQDREATLYDSVTVDTRDAFVQTYPGLDVQYQIGCTNVQYQKQTIV